MVALQNKRTHRSAFSVLYNYSKLRQRGVYPAQTVALNSWHSELPVCLLLRFFADIKITGNIEAEINIAFAPTAGRFTDKLRLYHTLRIGETQLEYVASGFYIPSQRPGIVNSIRNGLIRQQVIVFRI